MRSLESLLCAAAIVMVAAPARAQVALETQTNAEQVEVGQRFIVQLSATVAAGASTPQNPQLRVPPGVTASGPQIGTQRSFTFNGQSAQSQFGVTATWVVVSSRPGKLVIGPASVEVGGKRVADHPVTIQVLRQGQTPQRSPSPFGAPFDPFDMFNNFGNMPMPPQLGPGQGDDQDQYPEVPPEYRTGKALDPTAFLRATAEPTRVVVGQQLTMRVFAYGSRGPFQETTSNEPSATDFISYNLITQPQQPMYRLQIEGSTFYAVKMREFALFPIHTGSFAIGKMAMGFANNGYPVGGRYDGRLRESAPVQIVVTEPPLEGRPPGYRIGDVGNYQLTAEVSPREVVAGGAISVVARLEGTGYVPQKLKIPERRDVDWSDPTLTEQIAPKNGKIGGFRRFTYVVHLTSPGTVDLGELKLPYWDPDKRAYTTATAALGSIRVTPNPDAKKSDPVDHEDPLANLMVPRKRLGAAAVRSNPLSDKPWFWPLLAFAPLSVLTFDASMRLGRRIRKFVLSRREAKDAIAARVLVQASTAASHGDVAQAAGAVERAVYLAIEGATGLRARGVLRADLSGELMRQGVPESVAVGVCALLDECDGARFVRTTSGRPAADGLVARAEDLVRQLGRSKLRKKAA